MYDQKNSVKDLITALTTLIDAQLQVVLINVWKYNFKGHLKEKHPNIEESEFSDMMVSEEKK